MSITTAIVLILLQAAAPVEPPHDPGLYQLSPQGLVRLEGRSVSVARSRKKVPLTGSLPMSGGNQTRAEILGEHAARALSATPVFYYRVPSGQEGTGAGDLVLVKLRTRGNHREFTISTDPEWNSNAGVPLRSQVEFNARQVESGVFRLEPADDLDPGEYGFYLFRGRDLPGFLYDFSVSDSK
ncbi:MAG TPA: hypothetical protein VG860_20505 [Terriglobia bacterium]|jgi:hypothetical protein|nr:hypothetical protein [Terriglobia bacterium]